jgi:hypothetical protein
MKSVCILFTHHHVVFVFLQVVFFMSACWTLFPTPDPAGRVSKPYSQLIQISRRGVQISRWGPQISRWGAQLSRWGPQISRWGAQLSRLGTQISWGGVQISRWGAKLWKFFIRSNPGRTCQDRSGQAMYSRKSEVIYISGQDKKRQVKAGHDKLECVRTI